MGGALTRSIGRTSGAAVVSLSDLLSSYLSGTGVPDDSYVTVTFKRDGSYTVFRAAGGPANYTYVTPNTSTVGDAYDVRVTLNSGSGPNSGLSVATWYQINADRAFTWTKSGGSDGSYSGNITIEIRPFGGGGTLATSGTCTITAQVVP